MPPFSADLANGTTLLPRAKIMNNNSVGG